MKRNSDKPINSASPEVAFSRTQSVTVTYEAVYVSGCYLRKVWFEAANLQDARDFAAKHGFGLQGERPATPAVSSAVQSEPAGAFNSVEARRYLGGISRTALYRLLVRRILKRAKKTRRVLVTRKSMDAYLNDVERN